MSRCTYCGNKDCVCDNPQDVYISENDIERIAQRTADVLEERAEAKRVEQAKAAAREFASMTSSSKSRCSFCADGHEPDAHGWHREKSGEGVLIYGCLEWVP